MAAVGMGGSTPWVQPPRGAREALTLETVTLAVELGVDVNAANADGRTALDAAKTAKLESVIAFLVEHGAKPGSQPKTSSPEPR
jgi:ankyrin repeat protein